MRSFVFLFVLFSIVTPGIGDDPPDAERSGRPRTGQTQPTAIRAEVNLARSMVQRDGGKWKGYEVDLCRLISQEIGQDIELHSLSNPDDYFQSARDGSADIVFGGLTITADRENSDLDFSHPTFDSGLSIAVRWDNGKEAGSRIMGVLQAFLTWVTVPMLLLLLFLGCVLMAQFKKKESSSTLLGGVVLAMMFLLCVGINANVQHDLHEQDEQIADISSAQDLEGLRVVTKRNTTSVDRLHEIGAEVIEVESFERAAELLQSDEEIDALVFDSPVVWDYERGEGNGLIKVVGEHFDYQKYGFAFKEGNYALQESVNIALLNLEKSGQLERLRSRYFGSHR